MLELVDDWHDWWRITLLILSTVVTGFLAVRFYFCHSVWGEEDRDDWFMQLMWAIAAWAMQVEGMLNDSPLVARLPFVTAALLLMLRLQTKVYKRNA